MTVTIYHNPDCGTSRNVLAMIRNAGIEPRIIEYLETPPTRDELLSLVARMGIPLRAVLRRKGTPFDELGLGDPDVTDDALLDAVERHPILINRPIVITPRSVKLCRPSEVVLEVLDTRQRTAFVKEDGDPVVMPISLAGGQLEELHAALESAALPNSDITLAGRQLYRFTTTLGELVGFGGLEGDGGDRLVRSVVVLPSFRRRGYGKAITIALERLAVRDGATRLHLLTETAVPFFQSAGYVAAERAAAPSDIAASAEFTKLCQA
ncbi:MAG: arsC, partial [Rhodospirillales bacterium]|nr:arsC [Rhodospirillales bacterium]